MKQHLIVKKLASLQRCQCRVQTRCPTTQEGLRFDPDAQDIVSLNLMRAFQLAVDIGRLILGKTKAVAPNTPNATFEQLQGFGIINNDLANRLTAADAFKEMVLHNSAAISWETVFCSLPNCVHNFQKFAQAVDHWLSQQPPNGH